MKRIICLIVTIIAVATMAFAPEHSQAASIESSVTGVGAGTFPSRSNFAGIILSRFDIATGVITDADGSAVGVFHAVLAGRSLLGSARNITLEGNVTQGTGSGGFSGLASLDLGDGVPAVSGIPFNVEIRDGSMILTIQSTLLPAARFDQGGVDIE